MVGGSPVLPALGPTFFELFPRFVSETAESPLSKTILIQFSQTILPAQSLNSQIPPSWGMTIFPCSVLLSTQSGGSAIEAAPFWFGASRVCEPYRTKTFPLGGIIRGSKGGPSSGRIVSPVEGGYSVPTVARYFTARNPAGEAGIFRLFEARSRLSGAERNQGTKRAGNARAWQSLVLHPGKTVHAFDGKIGEAFNNLNLEVWKTVHDLPLAGIVRKRSH